MCAGLFSVDCSIVPSSVSNKNTCQVKWQCVWCFHCFALRSHCHLPPVLALRLFFDFANFPSLSLSLSLSPLYCLSHSFSVKLVFTLRMFSFRSHYGLKPPSLTLFLCSSSWRLQLCSSLLLAFLVRYGYSFSLSLFVSRSLYEHISRFPKMNSLFFSPCLC